MSPDSSTLPARRPMLAMLLRLAVALVPVLVAASVTAFSSPPPERMPWVLLSFVSGTLVAVAVAWWVGTRIDDRWHAQAERSLRDSEELYRSLVSSLAEGMAVQNRAAEILACNASAERILGLTREQMMGRSSIDPRWRAVRTDGLAYPGSEHPVPRTLRTGIPIDNESMGVHTPDGRLTWISITTRVVRTGADGLPDLVVATFADITRRTELEAQLLHAQKLEAIGTLAGGIAHDFNNLLTAVYGNAQLLERRLAERRPEDQGSVTLARPLNGILTGCRRGQQLVRQLLMFSRKHEAALVPLQAEQAVAEAMRMMRASLPGDLIIDVQLPSGLPTVLADTVQIQQVVMNLCTNAAHAMHAGAESSCSNTGSNRGKLTVAMARIGLVPGQPRPDARLSGDDYVRLSVSDTGCGMTPALIARIFEPFFTTKAPTDGTGLGLAVVHGIVANHHGVITVDSTPGVGTTFAVWLPVLGGPATASSARQIALIGHNEEVLVVDDEPTVGAVVADLLGALGYRGHHCHRPQDALALIRAAPERFRALITDQSMPGMSGTELVAAARILRPDLPVILSSGYANDDRTPPDANQIALPKPFALDALGQALAKLIAANARSSGHPVGRESTAN